MFAPERVSVPVPFLVSSPEAAVVLQMSHPTLRLALLPTSKTRFASFRLMRGLPVLPPESMKSNVVEALTAMSPLRRRAFVPSLVELAV